MNPVTAPETLHAYATSLARRAHATSVFSADSGDASTALLTQLVADLGNVQAVVLERMRVAWPIKAEALRELTDEIVVSISGASLPSTTCAELIGETRQAVADMLDPDMLGALLGRSQSLNHLYDLPAPSLNELIATCHMRLANKDLDAHISSCRAQAAVEYNNATIATRGNHKERAVHHMYAADMATIDAYLCETSASMGDSGLLAMHARWTLVCEAMKGLPGLPKDANEAVTVIRRTLFESLGPADAGRLQPRLPQFDAR